VARQIVRRLRAEAPTGVRIGWRVLAQARGISTDPERWLIAATVLACRRGFGRSPLVRRSGGTIPALGMLAEAFGLAPLLLGLGTPEGGAHGPDERMDLAGWSAAVNTCAALWPALAAGCPTARIIPHTAEMPAADLVNQRATIR